MRLVPGLSGDDVLGRLFGLLGEDVDLRARVNLPEVTTDPSDPWVADVFDLM